MKIIRIPEPAIECGYGQSAEDPRDGLTLFGPYERGAERAVRWGVVGTPETVRSFMGWAAEIQRPVINAYTGISRPFYPGFGAAFGVAWPAKPAVTREIDPDDLDRRVRLDDKHQRVFKSVDLFAAALRDAERTEDSNVSMWFVVIPDKVHQYCRPQATVPSAARIAAQGRLTKSEATRRMSEPSLFPEMNAEVRPYEYDPNFHHQLKARLLDRGTIVQIVRESTVAFQRVVRSDGKPLRDLTKVLSDVAWNLSTAAFYKSGSRPWRLAAARRGVCYVGLAYKQDMRGRNPRTACCAAQMFLDSGDGFVFKSQVGPWYNPQNGDFHLKRVAAEEVMGAAIDAYRQLHNRAPDELFVHCSNFFNSDEWEGFRAAAGSATKVVGVQIREDPSFRLFRRGEMPVLRGTAVIHDARTAHLWSRGYIPRLQTYDGREVPVPLRVAVSRGDADIEVVLGDVLALTKLNYNSCRFADGLPVTLRFADAVGEILTAGPIGARPPLPFKFYI